jgi:glycosyltransferase involved in cell wall biosynthesis
VHPSRAEGLGNVLVESLLVGRPVVARSVGGIPEVVDPKVGALVTGDDPAAWAQAVEAVWGRLARGDLAPERLRRWGMRFAWEASGPQLGKLLRRVGAGPGLDEPAAGR